MKTKSKKLKKKSLDLKNKLYGINTPIDVYNHNLHILVGNIEMARNYIKFKDKDYVAGDREDIDGFCYKHFVYIGKDLKDYDTITHELTHAILNMVNLRGLYMSSESGEQENVAYLFGYVMGYVLSTKKWFELTGKKFIQKGIRI